MIYKINLFLTKTVLFIIAVVIIIFITFSVISNLKKGSLQSFQKLRNCSSKPNCLCSEEYKDRNSRNKIDPFYFPSKIELKEWDIIIKVLEKMGANVVFKDSSYIHAEFSSLLFRFKDDFELRRVDSSLHIRSSSRIGYSDFGKNKKRVLYFKDLLDFAFPIKDTVINTIPKDMRTESDV